MKVNWIKVTEQLPENDRTYLVWTGREIIVSTAEVYDDKKKQQMRELADADFMNFSSEEHRERLRNATGQFADFGLHHYFDSPEIYWAELPEPPC